MSLHTNTARKRAHVKSSAKVIKFSKSRKIKYLKFKARVTTISIAFLTFSSLLVGVVYFLVGQARLNVLNDELQNNMRELNSCNSKQNFLPKESCDDTLKSNSESLELNDKAKVF